MSVVGQIAMTNSSISHAFPSKYNYGEYNKKWKENSE